MARYMKQLPVKDGLESSERKICIFTVEMHGREQMGVMLDK